MHRFRRWVPLIIGSAAAILIMLLLTDAWPFLRGPRPETSEWYWPYRLRPFVRWWPAIFASLLMGSLGTWWMSRPPQKKPRLDWLVIFGLVLLHLGLQLALVYADRPAVAAELIDRTLAIDTSGYFWTAAQNPDMAALLREYPQRMPTFDSEHARTHPPGWILLNRWLIDLAGRVPAAAEWLAVRIWPLRCIDIWLLDQPPAVPAGLALASALPPLAAALVIVPLFGLGQTLLEPPAARLGALLTAAMPSLAVFTPLVDQLYPLVSVTIFWLVITGLKKRSSGRLLTAGVLLSILSFLSIGNAVLVLPLGIIIALTLWSNREPWGGWVRMGGVIATGCASLWVIYWLTGGVNPWTVTRISLDQHYLLVTTLRQYRWWVVWNLVDLLLFAGPLVFVGFFANLRSIPETRNSLTTRLVFGLIALVLILNFSGSTRGEVGRIWMFWMPLLAIPAAAWWTNRRVYYVVLWSSLGLLLAVGLAWRTVIPVIVVAQPPEMPVGKPEIVLKERLGDHIILEGYSQALGENALEVMLFWTTDRPTIRPYTVFNHLVSPGDGRLVSQADGWSGRGQWPPTCWPPGERIVDHFSLSLDGVPPGRYELQTGLYDRRDSSRLTTAAGSTAVILSPVIIGEKTP